MTEESNGLSVLIISGFDPMEEYPSGVRTYVLGLTKSLTKMGIHVRIVGIGQPGELESLGVEYVSIQERPTSSIAFLFRLTRVARRTELAKNLIIHAQRPDYLTPMLMFHPDNPTVVTLHGSHADSVRTNKGYFMGRLYDQIETYTLKRTAGIICISKASYSHFHSKHPHLASKMRLIYAGIDMDIFKRMSRTEARRKLGLDENARILLYAGRFVGEKRVDVIIRAFKQVEALDENAQLILAGEGQEKTNLLRLANELELKRAIFRPFASRSELPIMLSAADATIVASRQEGLPTIVMESLACGTPVISTSIGIVPEIVKDGVNGFIFSDIDSLPTKIGKALATSSALSNNCPESVRRFAWDSIAREIVAVYNEVST